MTHREAAKTHFRDRMIERYGRAPSMREVDQIRLSIKNKRCFLWKDLGPVIKGIVYFQNIAITVLYDKNLDGMVTAGIKI